MKKYIAPEVEIKRFAVESIMASGVTVEPSLVDTKADYKGTTNPGNVGATVSYKEIFNIG